MHACRNVQTCVAFILTRSLEPPSPDPAATCLPSIGSPKLSSNMYLASKSASAVNAPGVLFFPSKCACKVRTSEHEQLHVNAQVSCNSMWKHKCAQATRARCAQVSTSSEHKQCESTVHTSIPRGRKGDLFVFNDTIEGKDTTRTRYYHTKHIWLPITQHGFRDPNTLNTHTVTHTHWRRGVTWGWRRW